MIDHIYPCIYQPILAIEPLDIPESKIEPKATVENNLFTSCISERIINELSINVYSKELINETEIDDIIECTNTAFKYDRLNKDKVIQLLNKGTSFIVLKQDDKIISSLAATLAHHIIKNPHIKEFLTDESVFLSAFSSIKKGAGKYLIKKTETLLSSQGFKKIILNVLGNESDFMHKYYQQLCFKPIHHHYDTSNDKKIIVTIYIKDLNI